MELTKDDSSSHALDGVDRDNPQNRREYVPISQEARKLVSDYEELRRMSDADVQHYSGKQQRRRP